MANPTLSGFSPTITFGENLVNAVPQLLDSDVSFAYAGSSLSGGRLTLSGLLTEDRAAIRNQGAGAGQVGVSGTDVTYGGVTIGTLAGGVGAALSITFNAQATSTAVDALIQNLTYANVSDTPTATRTLFLNVVDAAGVDLGRAAVPASFTALSGVANPFNGVNVGTFSAPTFSDIDADGDLDAVIGAADGTLRTFRNDGGQFSQVTGAANPFNGIDIGKTSNPAFVDFDGDGDLDLVVGEYNGAFRSFENVAGRFLSTTRYDGWYGQITGSSPTLDPFNGVDLNYISAPTFMDVDNDGDLDAVMGSNFGQLQLFRNDGGRFNEVTGAQNPFRAIDVGYYSTPDFVDLDGDGDLDLVVGAYDGKLRLFRNDGGSYTELTGPANPFNGIDIGSASSVGFVDVDGDGDLDAVVGAKDGTLRTFANTTPHGVGTTVSITPEAETAPTSATNLAQALTYREDAGPVDFSNIVVTDPTGTATITATLTLSDAAAGTITGLTAGTNGRYTATGSAATVNAKLAAAAFAPAANGNADVTVAVSIADGTDRVVTGTITLDGTAVNDAPTLTGLTSAITFEKNTFMTIDKDVSFADPDDNFAGGRLTVSGLLADDNVMVPNYGYAPAPGRIAISGNDVTYGGVAFGTMSGGQGETLTVTFNAEATSAAIDALIETLVYVNVSDTPSTSRTLMLNLVDAAGADLGASAGPATFSAATGTANPFDRISVVNQLKPAFVDVDGDGDLDAVFGTQNGRVRTFSNDGGHFTELTGTANPFRGIVTGGLAVPSFVDLDSDGDMDAVFGATDGLIRSYRNDGGQFTELTGTANPFDGVDTGFDSAPGFVDLDGDGDLDAVIGSNYGNLRSYRNDGGRFTELTGAENPFDGTSVGYSATPAFVDLDGDGDLDAVVGAYDGTLHAFRNDGARFVELQGGDNPFAGVDVGIWSTVGFADLDGDDDQDAVIGVYGGTVQTFTNTTAHGQAITITLQENTAPTATNLSQTLSYAEDAASVALGDIVVTDADGSDTITASFTLSDPAAGTITGLMAGANGTYTVSGTVVVVNAALAAATFVPTADSSLSATIAVSISDGRNAAATGTITLGGTAVNDAPVAFADTLSAIAEDSGARTIAFSELTANDSRGPANESAQTLTIASVSGAIGGTVAIVDGAVVFTPAADFSGTASFAYVVADDGTINGVADPLTSTGRASFTVTDVNDAPTLTDMSTVTFAENTVNAAPQLIDSDVTFADPEGNFDGGQLALSGLLGEDRAAIRNQGTGAGQIGVSGSDVTYGGVTIGTVSGGVGATLNVSFNAMATSTAIDALIQNLTYANVSDTPTETRTLTLNVTDATGAGLGPAAVVAAFAPLTDAANPFDGTNVGEWSTPAFVDLDGDGDLDAVVGQFYGTLHAFRNDGGRFTALTGTADPFDGVDTGYFSKPGFVDLDGDGDLDAVVGAGDGRLRSFRNDGDRFTEMTGTADPFSGADVGYSSTPTFVDLDGDGDLDAVVGEIYGTLRAFRNDGGGFTALTGSENPFNGIDIGYNPIVSFADLDGDGDLDAVVGEVFGTLRVFRDDGDRFTELTAEANPFNGVSVASDAAPSFVDLDNDGDLDLVVGASNDGLSTFINTTPAGQAIVVTVTPETDNTAPTATNLSQTLSYTEDAASVALDDIVVTDADAGDTITATVTLSDPAAGTITGLTADENGNYTVSGTVAVVNAALAAATFVPTADSSLFATIAVSISDGRNEAATGTITLSGTEVNDAPVAFANTLTAVAEDSGPRTISFGQLTGNDNRGAADERAQKLTITSVSGAIGGTVAIVDGTVVFTPTANFDGTAAFDYAVVDDGTTNGVADPLTGTARVSFTVAGVNDVPTLTGLSSALTFAENTVKDAPQLIDDDVTFADIEGNFDGGQLTLSGLLGEDRAAIRNQGMGAGQIGVSGTDVTYGGVTIGTVSGGVGAMLSVALNAQATSASVDALIQNLTYANISDTPTETRTLTLNVTDGTLATFAQVIGAENPFDGTSIFYNSTPSFVDLDADGDADAVVGAVDGTLSSFRNDGGIFTPLTGSANPFDGFRLYESTPSFVDLDGDGDQDAIVGWLAGTLRTFVNDEGRFTELTDTDNPFYGLELGFYAKPSFADIDGDGDLDLVVGDVYGTVRTFRNDDNQLTELTGADNPFNGVDVVNDSAPAFVDLDGDGDLDAVIGSSDGSLQTFINVTPHGQTITVTVTPESDNSAPSTTELNLALTYNEDIAVALGAIVVTDPDASDTITATFTLSDPAAGTISGLTVGANGVYTVSGSVAVVNASLAAATFVPTANSSRDATIAVSIGDGINPDVTGTITLDGTAVNDAPTGAVLAGGTVSENAATGTLVGTISAVDPDAGDSFTYRLLDDAAGRFAIDVNTGQLTVANGVLLDYEAAVSHAVQVQVRDAAGATYQQTVTVALTDIVETQTKALTASADTFAATSNDNWLVNGLAGDDSITTLGGSDVISGGAGNDTISTGSGGDIITFYQTKEGYDAIDGGDGVDRIHALANNTVIGLRSIANVEVISANGYAGVSIAGTSAADTLDFSTITLVNIARIDGGAGNDVLTGSAGNDQIVGGAGNDILTGGAGDDQFTIGALAGIDLFDGGTGQNRIVATAAKVTIGVAGLRNIQEISSGGYTGVTLATTTGDDSLDLSGITLTGITRINLMAGDDMVTGSAGNDVIVGGTGNDMMDGGAGDDVFQLGFGAGTDIFEGGSGRDQVVATSANTVIGLSALRNVEEISAGGYSGVTLATTAGNDVLDLSGVTLTGIGRINLGSGNDLLTGSADADVIVGGTGDDILNGGAGDDVFEIGTGAGTDRIDGGTGWDTVKITATSFTWTGISNVEALAGTNLKLNGTAGGDLLDFGAMTLSGVARINAGAGDDRVIGSAGADLIDLSDGRDVLTGGGGADVFAIDVLGKSQVGAADIITDFAQGSDLINLADLDASTRKSGNQAFTFIGDGAFTGLAGELRFVHADDSTTTVYGDVNGDRLADFQIDLASYLTLKATDFTL